jgi:outer membrane protein OmpA-like peptidoglycan-associated protein
MHPALPTGQPAHISRWIFQNMTDNSNQHPFGSIPIAGEQTDKEAMAPDQMSPAAETSGLPDCASPSATTRDDRARKHPRQMTKKRLPGWLWVLLMPVAAFVFYLVAGYLLMPYLLRDVLPGQLARALDRPVTVGAAEFNPFTLTVTLQNTIIGPKLAEPDDDVDPLLSFSRLKLELAAASLFKLGLICRKVEMERFFLHLVRRENATYNLQELLPARADGKSASLLGRLRFSLNNITVNDSRLLFDDRPTGKTHQIEEISLALPTLANLSFRSDQYLNPRFSARINGSPLNLAGETKVTPEALEARLSLRLKQLDLPSYFAYLPVNANFTPTKGLADLDLDLVIQTDAREDARLQIEGTGHFFDVWLQATADGKELARLPSVKGVVSFAPLSGRYRLKDLSLQKPELFLDRAPDGQWLIPRFTVAAGAMEIDRLHVTGGKLFFVDRQVKGGFADTWSEVHLSLDGFATDRKEPANFAASGRTREQSRLSAQGRLFSAPLRVEGIIIGHQLQLAAFNPYLEEWQRLRVQAGEIVKIETAFTATSSDERIDFSCSGLAARIDGLALARQDEKWLHLPQLILGDTSLHWPARRLEIGTIQATNGSLLLSWDQAGHLNWSPTDGGTGQNPWQLAVRTAEMNGTTVTIRTAVLPEPLTMEFMDTNLTITDLAEKQEGQGQLNGSARLFGEGLVELGGTISLHPFTANLGCRTEELSLTSLRPLFSGWFRPTIEAGVLRIDGEFRLPGPHFQGAVEISQFAAALEQKEILRWQQATASDLTVQLAAGTLQAGDIFLRQPFVDWTLAGKGGSSLADLFDLSWTTDKQSPRLAIGQLELAAGELAFADLAASPPYHTRVSGIKGTIGPLISTGDSSSRIDLTGSNHDHATFVLRGTLEPFGEEATADLNMEVRQFALAPLSPYLSGILGYRLAGGTIDLMAALDLNRHQLQATNRLRVAGLRLNEQLDRASRLPLTLALHTNQTNHLELDLPVSGHTGDPDFSYREELRRALRHLLLKTAVSPHSLLEPMTPTGVLQEFLTFSPGQAELNPENRQQLQQLTEILGKRPRLQLLLHGFADAEYDRPALKKRLEATEKVRQLAREAQLTQKISTAYSREEIPSPAQAAAGPESRSILVTDEMLQELAVNRSESIRRYLVANGISVARLTVAPTREPVPPGTPGRRGNRVDIELKALR